MVNEATIGMEGQTLRVNQPQVTNRVQADWRTQAESQDQFDSTTETCVLMHCCQREWKQDGIAKVASK
jgi:hypothetical protein